MPVNKVVFGDETLIDISDSTVTADSLLKDAVAYSADGTKILGTLEQSGGGLYYINVDRFELYGANQINPTTSLTYSHTFPVPYLSDSYSVLYHWSCFNTSNNRRKFINSWPPPGAGSSSIKISYTRKTSSIEFKLSMTDPSKGFIMVNDLFLSFMCR